MQETSNLQSDLNYVWKKLSVQENWATTKINLSQLFLCSYYAQWKVKQNPVTNLFISTLKKESKD